MSGGHVYETKIYLSEGGGAIEKYLVINTFNIWPLIDAPQMNG